MPFLTTQPKQENIESLTGFHMFEEIKDLILKIEMGCFWHYLYSTNKSNYCHFEVDYGVNSLDKLIKRVQS